MAAFRSDLMRGVRRLRPDALVMLFMAAWWVLNLLQAAFTGLANDEAYYWYYAQHLDWGYFDHPPMVALLVRLSSWLPGSLGIRFCSTLLQPLYLLLFWHLIRPPRPTRRDAWLYSLICFSMPMLQLYGFLALPDAPLMMTTVVFLWAFRRFCDADTTPNALLLALSVALMGYSKYHGALVLALALLANPGLLRRWRLWLAGGVCLVLFAPHMLWQQAHDWPTLRYHLVERNRSYDVLFTAEYLLNLVLVFNPLWAYHYVRGTGTHLRRLRALTPWQRTLLAVGLGFPLFFLFSTLRGHTQPQWLLPAVFPLVALLFGMARRSVRTATYMRRVGVASLALFLVVRVVAVANPFHLKGELWDNPSTYATLARVADGRPVQFMHNYAQAAKYAYYTGQPTVAAPYYYRRRSQWQYDTADYAFAHRSVVVGDYKGHYPNRVDLPNGQTFSYTVVDDFLPLRHLQVTPLQGPAPLVGSTRADRRTPISTDTLDLVLSVLNPTPADISSTADNTLSVILYFLSADGSPLTALCPLTDTLRAWQTTLVQCKMALPGNLRDGEYLCGFSIGHNAIHSSDNAIARAVTVDRGRR